MTRNASHVLRAIPAGAAVRPVAAERSSFSIPLYAVSGSEAEKPAVTSGSATLSLRPDNVIEYRVRIVNSSRHTFTQAQVVHVASDSTFDVIATLFADVTMRGARISVRGTASLSRFLPPEALLARIREHPEEYRVVIRGNQPASGTLAGPLGGR